MSSIFSLTSIPERVISEILAYSGTLALHELVKSGDRILSAKLSSSECTIEYRAEDEFGNQVRWSKYALTHLKGIRSISLFAPASGSGSLEIVEKTLSCGAAPDLRSLTIETKIDQATDVFGDQRFHEAPRALSVTLPEFSKLEEFHRKYSGLKDANFCGLHHHILLPRYLKALTLELDIKYTEAELLSLPHTLESLVLSTPEIHGIDWLAALPDLKKLTAYELSTWRCLDSDFTRNLAASRFLPLQELILPNFEKLACENHEASQAQEVAFFGILGNLICLKMPKYAANRQVWSLLKDLAILHCALNRTNYTTHLPPHLVELWTRISISTSLMTSLATSLRVLDNTSLVLSSDLVQLLPRNLEVLGMGNIYGSQVEIFKRLPQTLRKLRISSLKAWAYGPLVHLPASLQVLELSSLLHVRAMTSHSVDNSGWTYFDHALSVADLEAIEHLFHLLPTKKWSTVIPPANEPKLESLDWLYNRGLLAHPPSIQRLDSIDFLHYALSHCKCEQVHAWILERLTPGVWSSFFKKNGSVFSTTFADPTETYLHNIAFYSKKGFHVPN